MCRSGCLGTSARDIRIHRRAGAQPLVREGAGSATIRTRRATYEGSQSIKFRRRSVILE